jgi:DNA anti-recombination protein RmuC
MPPNHISTIMFLPSDAAISTIIDVDSNFLSKSWEQQIIPLGPSGFVNILSHAKFIIQQHKQHENYEHILEQIQKLLQGIMNIHEYSQKLGNNIKYTMQAYDKFASSFNNHVVKSIKNIQSYGVTLPKTKTPTTLNLERYQLVSFAGASSAEIEEKKEELVD